MDHAAQYQTNNHIKKQAKDLNKLSPKKIGNGQKDSKMLNITNY